MPTEARNPIVVNTLPILETEILLILTLPFESFFKASTAESAAPCSAEITFCFARICASFLARRLSRYSASSSNNYIFQLRSSFRFHCGAAPVLTIFGIFCAAGRFCRCLIICRPAEILPQAEKFAARQNQSIYLISLPSSTRVI